MPRIVVILPSALADIQNIYRYITERSGLAIAERILEALEANCARLSTFAERGNVPKEIQMMNRSDYRELHYKPYRIIYKIADARVFVYCIADGRRDMPALLRQRLPR